MNDLSVKFQTREVDWDTVILHRPSPQDRSSGASRRARLDVQNILQSQRRSIFKVKFLVCFGITRVLLRLNVRICFLDIHGPLMFSHHLSCIGSQRFCE